MYLKLEEIGVNSNYLIEFTQCSHLVLGVFLLLLGDFPLLIII
jgi:hypothetical protein